MATRSQGSYFPSLVNKKLKRVKIGLLLEQFEPSRGGLEHWTWQYAHALRARGQEVHVVAFTFAKGLEGSGLVLHPMGERPRSRLERAEVIAAHLPSLGLDLTHDMGIGWQADIIHPHGGSTRALWEHNLLRIPRWRQIRFWRERRYRELAELERRQHTRSEAVVVAVSEMVRRHFETWHHLPPARLRVIPNGVDVAHFTPTHRQRWRAGERAKLGVKEEEVLYLMLAHNLLLKNAEAFLRAAACLVRSGAPARVLIAGGKKTESFVRLSKQLGMAAAVTFTGVVEPIPLYAAADVFVHPTWYDPCSLVTLEAAASGLPVITTRYNGAAEFMTDGEDGYVLDDPADFVTLAARMEELLEPARRQAMGTAGRSMAERHTFAQQTTQFLELYADVIAARSAP